MSAIDLFGGKLGNYTQKMDEGMLCQVYPIKSSDLFLKSFIKKMNGLITLSLIKCPLINVTNFIASTFMEPVLNSWKPVITWPMDESTVTKKLSCKPQIILSLEKTRVPGCSTKG